MTTTEYFVKTYARTSKENRMLTETNGVSAKTNDFESFHEMKRQALASKKTHDGKNHMSRINIRQSCLEPRKGQQKPLEMRLKLSEEMLNDARMKIDDIVDILYSKNQDMWQIKISSKGNGYKITKRGRTNGGLIRLSLLGNMKIIDTNDNIKSVSINADEKTIQAATNPVSITFKLDYSSKSIKLKK